MYLITRHYGPNKTNADYLTGWDDTWGTCCGGDATRNAGADRALTFTTEADAQAARDIAQRECRGANGPVDPAQVEFRVQRAPAVVEREHVLATLNAYRQGWIGYDRHHVLQLQKRLVALNAAMAEPEPDYEARVQALIAEGMCRGDAQGVVDAQQLTE